MASPTARFKGVNSRDANFTANKLKAIIADIAARLEEYFTRLDQADTTETPSPVLGAAQLLANIAVLQQKREWHARLLLQLEQGVWSEANFHHG